MATKFEPGIAYHQEGRYAIATYDDSLTTFENKESVDLADQDPALWERDAKISVEELCESWGITDEEMDSVMEAIFYPQVEAEPEFSFA